MRRAVWAALLVYLLAAAATLAWLLARLVLSLAGLTLAGLS